MKKKILTALLLTLFYNNVSGFMYPMPPDPANSLDYVPNTYQAKLEASTQQVTGTIDIAVLLVNFTNKGFSIPQTTINNKIFGDTTSTVKDYYQKNSYGKLTINGSTFGIFASSHNMEYYGEDLGDNIDYANGHPNRLVRETVLLANDSVDFSNFDRDGNGIIDYIMVIHAGDGQETNSGYRDLIWSHYSSVSIQITSNLKIEDYTMAAETSPMGIIAHELGHDIGHLPDLYDIDGTSDGIGKWGMMSEGSWNGDPAGSNPAHFCAWSKIKLGWITPIEVTDPLLDKAIAQVETNAVVYKLPIKTSEEGEEEYFLVENRQQIGYDSDLPGSGLLIWHIDESMSDNSNDLHRLVDLEEADNNNSPIDASDTYKDTKSGFGPSTTPSSNDYEGIKTGWRITDINKSGSVMRADLSKLADNDIKINYIKREEIIDLGESLSIEALILNGGINTQTNFEVNLNIYYQKYAKDNIFSSENFQISELSYEESTTIQKTVTPTNKGQYIIEVYVYLKNDEILENNRKIVHTKVADIYFNDSVEYGDIGWNDSYSSSEGYKWQILNDTEEFGDAYKGNYGWYFGHKDNSTINATDNKTYFGALIFQQINLSNFENAYLTFFNKYDLRASHDATNWSLETESSSIVEIEIYNGSSWVLLGRYSGAQLSWRRSYFDISNYCGQNISLKFNITALNILTSGGWWMDNIMIISDPFIHDLILLPVENETKIDPGKETTLKVMLINIGDLNDTFYLDITSAEGLSFSLSDEEIELDFDETTIITITISASESIERGKTFYINVSATSATNNSLKSIVELKIKSSTSSWRAYVWLYVIVGLLIVGLIIWSKNS